MTLIFSLDEHSPRDFGICGYKASNLLQLQTLDVPLPKSWVLSAEAFRQHLEGAGFGSTSRERTWKHGETSARAIEDMRLVCLEHPFAPRFEEALRERIPPETLLAVRSSATFEDLAGSSFAGLYHTELGVHGPEALFRAIRLVWASVFNPQVLEYCSRKGFDHAAVNMAVLIQELIPAEVSGVLFTVDPRDGHDGRMLLEATWGLGETLVSGRVNPDRYVFDWMEGRVLERHIAEKTLAHVVEGTRVVEHTLAPDRASAPTLEDDAVAGIIALGLKVQEHYGAPQDIEWALCEGRPILLQTRAITTLHTRDERWVWTTSDLKDGGVSSDVVTPMMASLYKWVFGDTMSRYLRSLHLLGPEDPPWMRQYYGRLYWNCGAVKECMLRVPGFDERSFDRDLGIDAEYQHGARVTPFTLAGVLRALPTLFALLRSYRTRLAEDRRWLEYFDARETEWRREIAAPGDLSVLGERLKRLLEELYYPTESAYFLTIYNNSNAKLEVKVLLDRLVAQGVEVSMVRLMTGLSDLSHLRPVALLWEVARRWAAVPEVASILAASEEPAELLTRLAALPAAAGLLNELEAFLDTYYYHGRRELDLTVPRWGEEPDLVLETLRRFALAPEGSPSPLIQNQAQRTEFEHEQSRVLHALPLWRRWWTGRLLLGKVNRMRRYLWWREEMRDRSTRAYALIRQALLRLEEVLLAERVLEQQGDLFFLRREELSPLLVQPRPDETRAQVLRRRRAYYASYRNFKIPDEIGSKVRPRSAEGTAGIIKGTGCSPGCARGRARLLHSLSETKKLGQGEILVTRFTDPGWTSLFAQLGAVVTETGGLLSHAAVIAREYGIPAVLDVSEAMRRIPDGALIEVDGDRGEVRLV